jgi:hypothetical protein
MSSPNNEFKDFFTKDSVEGLAEKFAPKPAPEHMINALIALVGENPKFYRNPQLRILVSNGLAKVTAYIVDEIRAGRKPELHIGTCAFMMLLGDRMASTYAQYASDEEKERFPFNPDDSISEEENEDSED